MDARITRAAGPVLLVLAAAAVVAPLGAAELAVVAVAGFCLVLFSYGLRRLTYREAPSASRSSRGSTAVQPALRVPVRDAG
jgi:hypothetical protein